MKILIKILLIIFLLDLSGCKWFGAIGRPYLSFAGFKIPDGTPAFQQGFKDGCSTSLYSRGNVLYRNRYGYRYDPKMIGNPEYRFGHSRGYTWCFQQVVTGYGGPNSSFDKIIQPHGYDDTFSAGNINSAWGGFFATPAPNVINIENGGLDGVMTVFGSGANSAFGANPIWAGNSKGQLFGQE